MFFLYNYLFVKEGIMNIGMSDISKGISCAEYDIDLVSGLYYPIILIALPIFINASANNPGIPWTYSTTNNSNSNLGILPPQTMVNSDFSITIDPADKRTYIWDDENGGFTLPDNSPIDPIQSNWIQRYTKEIGTTNIIPLGTSINTDPKSYTFSYKDNTSMSITVDQVSLKVGEFDYFGKMAHLDYSLDRNIARRYPYIRKIWIW